MSYLNRFLSPDSIVPDQYNPLDWDRYSYARNNPIKYNDPSGHKACDNNCESGDTYNEWKWERLYEFAQNTVEALRGNNDLEAMARIIDRAAYIHSGDWDSMMHDLNLIFLGSSHIGPGTMVDSHYNGDDSSLRLLFGDAKFNLGFQDQQNQVRHVWASIADSIIPYKGSPLSYSVGNLAYSLLLSKGIVRIEYTGHELLPRIGSWQDYQLSRTGANIGLLVSIGVVDQTQFGNLLRDMLGENSGYNPSLSVFTNPLMRLILPDA